MWHIDYVINEHRTRLTFKDFDAASKALADVHRDPRREEIKLFKGGTGYGTGTQHIGPS